MTENLIKLALYIPYISEYIYKIAGLKDDLISKYPQYKDQIIQLSDKGIEDSFLFSAVNLLDRHNKPLQKSEIEKERREREIAERSGKVFSPTRKEPYDVDTVFEIIMRKQTDGRSKYLVNELGFNKDTALKLIELFNKRASFIGKKIYDDIMTNKTFSSKKLKNTSEVSFEDLQNTYDLSFINDYIVVGLSGDLEYIKDFNIHYIFELANEWHENLEASEPTENYEETHEIILDFRNPKTKLGFYWAKLGKSKSQEEAERMGHCGNSSGNTLYSLREFGISPLNNILTNESHVTLSLSDSGIVKQCKGKKNSKPSLRFSKYIMALLSLKKPDSESEYFITGFESEYDQATDFSLSSLPKEILENTYIKRTDLFTKKDLVKLYNETDNNEIKKKIYEEFNFDTDIVIDMLQAYINLDDFTQKFLSRRFDPNYFPDELNYGYGHFIDYLPKDIQQEIYNNSEYKDHYEFEHFIRLLGDDKIYDNILVRIISEQHFEQFNDELLNVIKSCLGDFGKVSISNINAEPLFVINGNILNLANSGEIFKYLEQNDYTFKDNKNLLESLIADDIIEKANKINLDLIEHRFSLQLNLEQAKETLRLMIG